LVDTGSLRDAEIAGVEISAPECTGGNRGRRKSMESEVFRNIFLAILWCGQESLEGH